MGNSLRNSRTSTASQTRPATSNAPRGTGGVPTETAHKVVNSDTTRLGNSCDDRKSSVNSEPPHPSEKIHETERFMSLGREEAVTEGPRKKRFALARGRGGRSREQPLARKRVAAAARRRDSGPGCTSWQSGLVRLASRKSAPLGRQTARRAARGLLLCLDASQKPRVWFLGLAAQRLVTSGREERVQWGRREPFWRLLL